MEIIKLWPWSGNHAPDQGHSGVEATGLEPVTPCLQSRCAASCATPPGVRSLAEASISTRQLSISE